MSSLLNRSKLTCSDRLWPFIGAMYVVALFGWCFYHHHRSLRNKHQRRFSPDAMIGDQEGLRGISPNMVERE